MNLDELFPDIREQGETPLRQSQLVMLRMLKIVDYLCDKHNIAYFLVGGSLLGAIRHKGFIPWDDDLDIGMTRKNYEKFVTHVVPHLPNDIFFQTPQTDPHYPSCHLVEAKLRDKYSSYSLFDQHKRNKWHQGIMLDIFVYDRAFLPHNFFIYALNRSLLQLYWGIGKNNKGNEKRARVLKTIEKVSMLPFVYASGYIRHRSMLKLGSNFIKAKEIASLVRVKFEDMEVLVPKGWDACLKRQYGDYMKLPPLEKQRGHHSAELPNPFTPCEHSETLVWKRRKNKVV